MWAPATGLRRPPCCFGTTSRNGRWWPRCRVCKTAPRSRVRHGSGGGRSSWWTPHRRTGTCGSTASWPTSEESCRPQPEPPRWFLSEQEVQLLARCVCVASCCTDTLPVQHHLFDFYLLSAEVRTAPDPLPAALNRVDVCLFSFFCSCVSLLCVCSGVTLFV